MVLGACVLAPQSNVRCGPRPRLRRSLMTQPLAEPSVFASVFSRLYGRPRQVSQKKKSHTKGRQLFRGDEVKLHSLSTRAPTRLSSWRLQGRQHTSGFCVSSKHTAKARKASPSVMIEYSGTAHLPACRRPYVWTRCERGPRRKGCTPLSTRARGRPSLVSSHLPRGVCQIDGIPPTCTSKTHSLQR